MRLLGWMHNKIRHTSIQPFKDFTIGNYCVCLSAKSPVDDKVSYIRPRFDSRHEVCDNALSEVEAKKAEGNQEDQTSSAMPELFHGFLAIGTLGSKQVNSEPATPTFPMSLENIADEKIEATENDLKLINNEIEKFIDAEAEEGCNESLARSSYVSNITFSGIQTEGANADDYRNTALCPLQGYLFGSSIELQETTIELKKEKVSQGAFRRTKILDESSKELKGQERCMPRKHINLLNTSSERYLESFMLQEILLLLLPMMLPTLFQPRKSLIR
ncbi:hypothetical protein GH714_031998 [Hevea brasiliensis]|uniref:Uncharacterized protein n=1 Tax=Hevea brasiliensis TaxID=3981 RepID=A0A6A6NDT3_HEVBR|nr:hypothetical protein GH714_031998 [Hevea brasiliensis]